jgi:opacity protein-like surface antigen
MSRRMRAFALSAAAALCLAAGSVSAAPWDWTGFYAGGQVGGIFGLSGLPNGCPDFNSLTSFDAQSIFDPIDPLIPPGIGSKTQQRHTYNPVELSNIDCAHSEGGSSSAWQGGVRAGADVQYGNSVFGALLDYNWVGGNVTSNSFSFDPDSGVNPNYTTGTISTPGDYVLHPGEFSIGPLTSTYDAGTDSTGDETAEPGTPFQEFSNSRTLDWWGTGRLRAGVTVGPQGRLLIYGTGGVAYGQVTTKSTQKATYTPDEADRVFDSESLLVGGNGAALGNGEYNPPSDAIPDNCAIDVSYGPGAPPDYAGNQTGVVCSWNGSKSSYGLGYTVGVGAEFLATSNLSIGGEVLYAKLFTGPSSSNVDFWSANLTAAYRFK